MNQIRYKLSKYHAINKADIELTGITVLTGVNGCGKSTLLRSLFYALSSRVDHEAKDLMDEESGSSSIEIEVDGIPVSKNGDLDIPSLIENVIYQVPSFEASNHTSDTIWKTFQDLLLSENVELNTKERICKKMIRNTIGGEVFAKSEDYLGDKILFFRNNNGQELPLDKFSTGTKIFGYIQRLLDNGKLTSNTLLLIDGPEVHLHPVWIVEFARLLIYLHKHLGVRLMISTHNSDMVAAIHAISLQEKLEEQTNFYLAIPSSESCDIFDYRCLGMNTGPIFESFNLALGMIDTFGLTK